MLRGVTGNCAVPGCVGEQCRLAPHLVCMRTNVSLAAFALLQQLNYFVLKYMKVIGSSHNFVKNIAGKRLT